MLREKWKIYRLGMIEIHAPAIKIKSATLVDVVRILLQKTTTLLPQQRLHQTGEIRLAGTTPTGYTDDHDFPLSDVFVRSQPDREPGQRHE